MKPFNNRPIYIYFSSSDEALQTLKNSIEFRIAQEEVRQEQLTHYLEQVNLERFRKELKYEKKSK